MNYGEKNRNNDQMDDEALNNWSYARDRRSIGNKIISSGEVVSGSAQSAPEPAGPGLGQIISSTPVAAADYESSGSHSASVSANQIDEKNMVDEARNYEAEFYQTGDIKKFYDQIRSATSYQEDGGDE
ncbi:hypothetical protein IJJ39_00855 [Candidatus Saccharibacteria bacterium]|nr:hypothetical protein [Candidatus Saccharibacteria bacterium]